MDLIRVDEYIPIVWYKFSNIWVMPITNIQTFMLYD